MTDTEKTAAEVAKIIREAGLNPDELPAICRKLYPFQIRNVLSVRAREVALLAWQMGAGKTWGATALAELWGDKILIAMGPKAVVDQWVAILQIETDRNVYNSYKKGDLEKFYQDPGKKALCTRDDTVAGDDKLKKYINKSAEEITLIFDESSRLGDFKTKRTKTAIRIKAHHKLLLSGTPASGGRLEKLRPQMRMLGCPMTEDEFFNAYAITEDKLIHVTPSRTKIVRKPIEYRNIPELRKTLIDHGASFISMVEAGIQLPETTEIPVICTARPEYKQMMKNGITYIDGEQLVGDFAGSRLMKARQICGSYCPDKLNRLEDILEESAGERVVVFYNFIREREKIEALCQKAGRPISTICGQGKDLSAYEAESNSVTIVQYQSGAMGVNLQQARICVFFGPCYSYSDFEQAKARVHRIGQKNACIFYTMRCRGTVEEDIYEILEKRGTYTKELFAEKYGVPLKDEEDEGVA